MLCIAGHHIADKRKSLLQANSWGLHRCPEKVFGLILVFPEISQLSLDRYGGPCLRGGGMKKKINFKKISNKEFQDVSSRS